MSLRDSSTCRHKFNLVSDSRCIIYIDTGTLKTTVLEGAYCLRSEAATSSSPDQQQTHLLLIQQHHHFEDEHVIDDDLFILVQYLECLAGDGVIVDCSRECQIRT